MNQTLLVDGNHLAHRARYACSELATADGRLSGTIYGFLRGLCHTANLLAVEAEETVVVWDGGVAAWRRELCPTYKSGRKPETPTPEQEAEYRGFCEQLDALQTAALPSLGVRQVRVGGCEADDVLAVLASTLSQVHGHTVTLFSGDKDFHQLAGRGIRLQDPRHDLRTTEGLCEQWGVASPDQILLVRAIQGDASDKLPGVPGIGEARSKICARYWTTPDTAIPEKEAKIVRKAREEYRQIVERNLQVMRLPSCWQETCYTVEQGQAVFSQALSAPLKSPLAFAKLCNEWELQSLAEVVKW